MSDAEDAIPLLDPPREASVKRCSRCSRTEAEGASFGRNCKSLTGLRSACKQCEKASIPRLKTYPVSVPAPSRRCTACHRTTSQGAAFGRDRYHAPDGLNSRCFDCRRAADARSYWAAPERARAMDRESYWRDIEHTRQRRRACYWRNPENCRATRRAYYWGGVDDSRRRDELRLLPLYRQRRGRENHRLRQRYWANRDQINANRRLGPKRGPSPQRRLRWGGRAASLDAGRMTHSGTAGSPLMDRVADPNAINPQAAVIGKQERTAAFGWMLALSPDDQRILEAYADNHFDMAATAEALGLMQGNARRQILSLQDRARREIAGAVGE